MKVKVNWRIEGASTIDIKDTNIPMVEWRILSGDKQDEALLKILKKNFKAVLNQLPENSNIEVRNCNELY